MSKDKSSGVYDDVDKEMEKSADERFLRLEEDGDKACVFFTGVPYTRYVYWDGQQTREWTEDCGQKKNLRVAQNVITCKIEKGKLEIFSAKVLEQGKRFFQNVSKRDKKYGIQNWIFEIERSGNKGDTDTSYSIDPEHELSDKERERLMAMNFFDLEKFYAEFTRDGGKKQHEPTESKRATPEKTDDDNIIDETEVGELREMFQLLEDPEGSGKKFCANFGIKKVKFLLKSKLRDAVKYIDRLIQAERPSTENEDDSPF